MFSRTLTKLAHCTGDGSTVLPSIVSRPIGGIEKGISSEVIDGSWCERVDFSSIS